jgi:hypothetical protein
VVSSFFRASFARVCLEGNRDSRGARRVRLDDDAVWLARAPGCGVGIGVSAARVVEREIPAAFT